MMNLFGSLKVHRVFLAAALLLVLPASLAEKRVGAGDRAIPPTKMWRSFKTPSMTVR